MPIAVFLTSDIPERTLTQFLDAGQSRVNDTNLMIIGAQLTISDLVMIVTSKDYSQYPTRTTRPFQPFHSPFIGESPDKVASWFRGASDPFDVERLIPMDLTVFIILDEQTVKDNRSCLLVGLPTEFDYEPVQTTRCDFYIVHREGTNYEYGSQHFAFDYAGHFMRSRLVVTKKNQKLAERWSFLPMVDGVFENDGKNQYNEEYIQEY